MWYISTNVDKVKIFCVLHDKVALLTGRCSERGKRNYHQIIFRKVLILVLTIRKTLIKR